MKTISVNIAGQQRIEDIEINENTTSADVLSHLGLPADVYELSPAPGLPPFGKDEAIYDRVKSDEKTTASPIADAGAGA